MRRYISGNPTFSSSSSGGGGGGIVYTAGNDLTLSRSTFSLTDNIDVRDITAVDISGLGLYNLSGNGILINNSGFVGINLSGVSPTHHLDVSGNVRITGNLTANQFVGNLSGDNISGNTIYASNQFVGDLSGHHIYGTNISGVNITATQFLGNLSGDNISGVNITASDISSNHIYGHSISGVNITASDISSNHIYASSISGVNITASDISSNRIYATSISGVNITASDISSNHIYGTNISGAGVVNTSGAMTSDTKLATSKAIRDYVNSVIAALASAIVANTAKTGITTGQADAIVANTAKTGITSSQADAIVANTAKTGITSSQADAIVANTAKTGITTGQADAIVANTAKTGITTGQADAIVANTAKVGHTTPLVKSAMNTIIEKEATTDNTLIKFNGTTKMTLGEIGGGSIASFTTTELAGNTLVCDTTLRSNQSTTATSGDFLLKRNTTTKLTFGNALTTFKDDTKFDENARFIKQVGINIGTDTIRATLQVGDKTTGFQTSSAQFRSFGSNQSTFSGTSNAPSSMTSLSIYALNGIVTKGTFIATQGTMVNSSDDRIKSEEVEIENATQTLLKLTPKNYWKHSDYRVDEDDESAIPTHDLSGDVIVKDYESGVIAQQIQGVEELGHLVGCYKEDEVETLSVDYIGFIPFLIKSIQELNARIIELENRN
jgi:uncharacterized protein YjbI with pentapeptide repeats